MKLHYLALAAVGCAVFAGANSLRAQGYYDPPAASQALGEISSQRATATTVTFDREMLDALLGGAHVAGFNGVSFEHYQYSEPVFYIPEEMHALEQAYHAAGWKHLVDSKAGPRESASPTKPITDMWFHYAGGDIDHVTVLIRGRKEMNVVRVSGVLRPEDLVHLGGHFGIPKVDPGAVMVPAPGDR